MCLKTRFSEFDGKVVLKPRVNKYIFRCFVTNAGF